MKRLLLPLLFTACTKDPEPYHLCVKDHTTWYPVIYHNGKQSITMMNAVKVCDEYSTGLYIKLNDKLYKVEEVSNEF